MTIGNHQPGSPTADGLPEPEALLCGTDWVALDHARGSAEDVPAALATLFDSDPVLQARALDEGLEHVRHQNSIYPATVPAALYIAAILPDPRTTMVGPYDIHWPHLRERRPRPLRAALLDWLGSLAHDADDESAELDRRYGPIHPPMDAVRALRPVLFQAVAVFLHDDDLDVHHAALVAAVPLVEHPELAHYGTELVPCARRLLATSTDRYYRARAIDGLTAWGHDTQDLLPSGDITAHAAPDPWAGGCTDDPPF